MSKVTLDVEDVKVLLDLATQFQRCDVFDALPKSLQEVSMVARRNVIAAIVEAEHE